MSDSIEKSSTNVNASNDMKIKGEALRWIVSNYCVNDDIFVALSENLICMRIFTCPTVLHSLLHPSIYSKCVLSANYFTVAGVVIGSALTIRSGAKRNFRHFVGKVSMQNVYTYNSLNLKLASLL